MPLSKKKRIALLLSLLTITGIGLKIGLYLFNQNTYLIAGYEGIAEFSDSASDAILDGGIKYRVRQTQELDDTFESVIRAQEDSIVPLEFLSRDVIRRTNDGISIRFGETMKCSDALIYEDGTVICNRELYIRLSDAIDNAT